MGKKKGGKKGGSSSQPDGEADGEQGEAHETLAQLRARHIKEMKEHKKDMERLGKKQKDEIDRRTKEINDRHALELAALRKAKADEESDSDGNGDDAPPQCTEAGEQVVDVADLLASASIYGCSGANDRKPTKSQKRKQAKKMQDAEREARIAAEKEAMGPTDRDVEEARLQEMLRPQKLQIKEIPADGNCLYRALEDQLAQTSTDNAASLGGYLGLRKIAATYMRQHPDNYMPFVIEDCGDPLAAFENYCHDLENTAVWGGQVELDALANALQRHIAVFSTDLGCLDMGQQFQGSAPSLRVCYHRHAYGLGEHYNSIVEADV